MIIFQMLIWRYQREEQQQRNRNFRFIFLVQQEFPCGSHTHILTLATIIRLSGEQCFFREQSENSCPSLLPHPSVVKCMLVVKEYGQGLIIVNTFWFLRRELTGRSIYIMDLKSGGRPLPPPHRPGVKCGLVYTPALKHGKYDCLADHPVFVSDTGQESLQQQSLPAWRNLPQPPRFLFLYVSITVEGESPSPWLKIMMSQHQWFAWNPPDLFNSPSKVSRILWSPESE